jgi:hypothetical protein
MQTLTGSWKLARDENNVGRQEKWFNKIRPEAEDAPVPGIIQQVFPDYHGVAWYWRTFRPEKNIDRNHRCLLRFGAVDYLAEVWLNGIPVGGHEGGETPFTLDVTTAIKVGDKNLLAVRVLNPTDEPIDGFILRETPHCSKEVRDFQPGRLYNYGGILLSVELGVVPVLHITDVFTRPDSASGKIRIRVTVRNDLKDSVGGRLVVSAGPDKTGEVLDLNSIRAEFSPGETVHQLIAAVSRPRLWNLDDPYLYRVTVTLNASVDAETELLHQQSVRCGFREFRVLNGYFRLNGKRLFLRSTLTRNCYPIGQAVPTTPDFLRRDLLYAKALGFNVVRFIAGVAFPEQLDCCDEIGLMVHEECLAGWLLADSPEMARRFDLSVREMILRDRNHPSITIWGLLNETLDGPVFRHAVDTLPLVRSLDDTRLVLLGSGRWDCHPEIGSVSNPGSDQWEHEWGGEASNAKGKPNDGDSNHGGYFRNAGDAHVYPGVPHSPITINFIRNLGKNTKPVFLSEYGIGSMLDVIRGSRWFEQLKSRPDLADVTWFRTMAEKLEADWKRWGFENVCPFTQDLPRESQRLHTRQRLLGFDLIRSNPNICGLSLTSMVDQGLAGEGLWTFWRELKPGIADALTDGWAPLRWCLFAEPLHGYSGRKFKLEAVLANEDVLRPGDYPVILRVSGKTGTIWEKKVTAKIPKPASGQDGPLAVEVFCGEVKLTAPTGEYEFGAYMEQGGAPFGGRLKFYISALENLPKVKSSITIWGLDKRVEKWLDNEGVKCKPFSKSTLKNRDVILVGNAAALNKDAEGWRALAQKLAQGSYAVFLSPKVFVNTSTQTKIGNFERKGGEGTWGNYGISWREFDVPNVPKGDMEVFSKEFYGNLNYIISDLPNGNYEVELGMCEGCVSEKNQRIFDVKINGEYVLRDFDIVLETGGPHRAVIRKFKVQTQKGKIEINFCFGKINAPSVSRMRIYNVKGEMIIEDTALKNGKLALGWLPLENKGRCYEFGDWLYHKECVAKAHPIFDGLQAGGIMDWDYYGPVISHTLFELQNEPANVIVAAFASGYCCPSGYASGIMMAEYAFGKGRFITNTFSILGNIDVHPAADRLLLNMIHYAASFAKGPTASLPKNFDTTLKTIGYMER